MGGFGKGSLEPQLLEDEAPAPLGASSWPDPPRDEAFHGIAGEIVDVIEPHTEADPVAILVQLIVGIGNLIGRTPYFAVESDRHFTNEYAVLVGATSKGRKGTSASRVKHVLEQVDLEWSTSRLAEGLSSGEGLIWEVRDPIKESVEKNGEAKEVVKDPGVGDKRLFVLEGEFARPLGAMAREGNTLSAILRSAWDHGSLRSLTKNSPARATGAHVSIVAHSTPPELRKLLGNVEASNGFGNRFLWVCVKRSKCLPDGGNLQEHELAPLVSRLRSVVSSARRVGAVTRDDEARALWHEVYPGLSEGKPGLLGAMLGRAEAHVTRLALLYALLDESRVVGVSHLRAALALWDFCERSARFVFGDALGNPVADAILQALVEAPAALSRTEISALFARHKTKGEIDAALRTLLAAGLVRSVVEKTGGRDKEWFQALCKRPGSPSSLSSRSHTSLASVSPLSIKPREEREEREESHE